MHLQDVLKIKNACLFLGRHYATVSSGRHFRDKGPPLSLEHVCPFDYRGNITNTKLRSGQFLQKQRALNLWRDIVRSVNSLFCFMTIALSPLICHIEIPLGNTRSEMRGFARDEFERNRDVHDIGHIRYLISVGS